MDQLGSNLPEIWNVLMTPVILIFLALLSTSATKSYPFRPPNIRFVGGEHNSKMDELVLNAVQKMILNQIKRHDNSGLILIREMEQMPQAYMRFRKH